MQGIVCPVEIVVRDEAVEIVQKAGEAMVTKDLVEDIIQVLMLEFARDFPKRNIWCFWGEDGSITSSI